MRKFVSDLRNNRRFVRALRNNWRVFLAIILIAIGILGMSACTNTVTPHVSKPAVASWDGTNQNSGFIGSATNAAGKRIGGYLTQHGRDRYNALMAEYGGLWGGVAPDAGLMPTASGVWFIDAQHLGYFMEANWRKKNGKPPPK